jgi:hypothetical protein
MTDSTQSPPAQTELPLVEAILKFEPDVMDWNRSHGGDYLTFAETAVNMWGVPLAGVREDCGLFSGAVASVRKSAALAMLSALRNHRVEMVFNLRLLVESTCLMGYLAAHPDGGAAWKLDEEGKLADADKITGAAYKWVAEKYPQVSEALKRKKDVFNKHWSHANIENSIVLFDYQAFAAGKGMTSFFDEQDDRWVHMNMSDVGNCVTLALIMLVMVVIDHKAGTVRDGFIDKVKALDARRLELNHRINEDLGSKVEGELAGFKTGIAFGVLSE